MRVVLVPGRIAPWNGQMVMIDAARLMVASGDRNIVFVFAGDDRVDPRYTRALRRRARMHGIDTLCRFVGHCPDMPAALAAADVVVVPALEPPLSGRAAAEAQAMGRPVVVTHRRHAAGEHAGPAAHARRIAHRLAGAAGQCRRSRARAPARRSSLNATAYEALGARARQFAEFMFSPQSVAEAIRGVYTSLLARDA